MQINSLLSWQFKLYLTENIKLEYWNARSKHDSKIIGRCLVTAVHTRRAWAITN